jgi:hypothetical protein
MAVCDSEAGVHKIHDGPIRLPKCAQAVRILVTQSRHVKLVVMLTIHAPSSVRNGIRTALRGLCFTIPSP